jgi:tyrosyl-tRNA synthetase
MKFYIGADTTGSSLHLSHAKNFIMLEEFRKLGHEVYVLFGDLTACIGDPSEKDSARTKLTREKAKENAQSWINQITPIINFDCTDNPARVVYNSEWFDKFSVTELLELFANSTVQQMIERDMFQKRLSENKPIYLHEFLYPMFQGYDSVALDIDVELCGTDQIFNALSGRDLLKKYKNKEKFVVAVNLMENPKTGTLMSKSNNTGVFLGTDSRTLFGQIMAQPDEMIEIILVNDTRIPLEEIKALDIPNNPMKAKLFTAKEITKVFYGEERAEQEYENFINTFSNKNFSEDAKVLKVNQEEIRLYDLLSAALPDESKSNIRRLINQNAIAINGNKCNDDKEVFDLSNGNELQLKIGKKQFFLVRFC